MFCPTGHIPVIDIIPHSFCLPSSFRDIDEVVPISHRNDDFRILLQFLSFMRGWGPGFENDKVWVWFKYHEGQWSQIYESIARVHLDPYCFLNGFTKSSISLVSILTCYPILFYLSLILFKITFCFNLKYSILIYPLLSSPFLFFKDLLASPINL